MNYPNASNLLVKLYLRPEEMICPLITVHKHMNLDSQRKQLLVKLMLRTLEVYLTKLVTHHGKVKGKEPDTSLLPSEYLSYLHSSIWVHNVLWKFL